MTIYPYGMLGTLRGGDLQQTTLCPLLPFIFSIPCFFSFLFFPITRSVYPDQFTRTTTNLWTHWISHKSSGHVRHRGGDRHTQRGSNSGAEKRNKSLPPLAHDLKCFSFFFFFFLGGVEFWGVVLMNNKF